MLRPAQPLTLWAARTFGTAAHSLAALRTNPDGRALRLLASHVRADSPALSVADVAFLEPPLTGPAWVQWALEVCERESVDILWVTREAEAASAARMQFEALGTALLVPGSDALRRTRAKSDVYRRAERLGLPTPPWQRVAGADDALDALRRLEPLSLHGVCVKPDTGQGAIGVYRLVEDWPGLPVGMDLPRRLWLRHLRDEPATQWIMLPWLPGAEHSVDVLHSPGGHLLASAVRSKWDGSYEQIAWHDETLTAMSSDLLAELAVAPLGNVQWREHNGGPVLLEVNPRPSGGLFRSSQALGVDLLWAAVRQEVYGDAGFGPEPVTVSTPSRTTSLPGVFAMAVLQDLATVDDPAPLPAQAVALADSAVNSSSVA